MGKKLHVCTRVEYYGNTSVFNYTYNDFADLLCKYGCDVHYVTMRVKTLTDLSVINKTSYLCLTNSRQC